MSRAGWLIAVLALSLAAAGHGFASSAGDLARRSEGPVAALRVKPGGWAVHGRVYDSRMQPQRGYSVYLTDARGRYRPDIGAAYTDMTGYFRLQSTNTAPDRLYLTVSDAGGRQVYRASVPVDRWPGAVIYQSVHLSAPSGPVRSAPLMREGNPPLRPA